MQHVTAEGTALVKQAEDAASNKKVCAILFFGVFFQMFVYKNGTRNFNGCLTDDFLSHYNIVRFPLHQIIYQIIYAAIFLL